MKKHKNKGFTLIELLVVISIIGILMGLSLFSLQNSKKSGRDAKRKSDLELIRSGIEIYRADCGEYPTSLSEGDILKGTNTSGSCLTSNIYISSVPTDPLSPSRSYLYSSNGIIYQLCSALEGGSVTQTCGGSSNCGETCNYKVENP
ncbi:MAG: prepilin-type N-terminal cleavage/methylation domain-containing protein [Patescibacteria group bacterium]